MRSARRRAIVGALTAVLASSLAASVSATTAPALTIGLPAIEAKVPKVEVSLGPVHASTPETTVTVPSVGVSTPAPSGGGSSASGGGSSASGGGSSGGGGGSGGGVVVEVPVSLPTAPGKEHGATTTSGEAASTPVETTRAASSTTASGSSPAPAVGSTPASSAARRQTTATAHPSAKRGSVTPYTRARSAPAAVPVTRTVAGGSTGAHDLQPAREVSAAKASSSNPLEAIGGQLPLPLPVPDWSKPIILLLLLLALGLAVRARMSSSRAKRLELQRASLLDDLHAMQVALVPEVPAELAALGVSVAYRPADGVAAGGDFYDVFELEPGRVAVVLGDVCGHGREALERAALTRYTVRAYLQAGLEPRAALALAGRALADPEAHFATVAAAVYDSQDARLTYACAGHPAPIVLGRGVPTPLEVCCSPPVGWGIPTGRRQSRIPLPVGAVVCFFTDGLTEARCKEGLLGTTRLGELLASLGRDPSADELIDRVSAAADVTPDDMAACVLTAHSASAGHSEPGGEAHVEELEFERRDLDNGGLSRFLSECDLAGTRAAELLNAAEQALACNETALLQVELGDDGPRARILAPAETLPSDPSGSGERRTVTLLPPTPVHA